MKRAKKATLLRPDCADWITDPALALMARLRYCYHLVTSFDKERYMQIKKGWRMPVRVADTLIRSKGVTCATFALTNLYPTAHLYTSCAYLK